MTEKMKPEPTIEIVVRAPTDARVILLTDAHIVWNNANADLSAGCSLAIEREQARRLVDAGIARWPGRPPEPQVSA